MGKRHIMVGMLVCLCLASWKPSDWEFFVPARTHLGVKLLIGAHCKTIYPNFYSYIIWSDQATLVSDFTISNWLTSKRCFRIQLFHFPVMYMSCSISHLLIVCLLAESCNRITISFMLTGPMCFFVCHTPSTSSGEIFKACTSSALASGTHTLSWLKILQYMMPYSF